MPLHLLAVPTLVEALRDQWPIVAVFLGLPSLLFRYMMKQHAETIKSKDDEIKRLVAEKKFLQEKIFGQLLSTTERDEVTADGPQPKNEETVQSPKEPKADKPKRSQRRKS
jgi:hypothetical protein